MNKRTKGAPTAVVEYDNLFLRIFPHRFDYLYAPHPTPGKKPEWATESRYPLSDRLIKEGIFLYGVRFSKKTRYALLDIDLTSCYHPAQDALAIPRIKGVLEEKLGLVAEITVQSSYSGGLHLYYPFEEELLSWQIGTVITGVLENAGFQVTPGTLEVFPNRRPFTSDGSLSLFNGHRLPLQAGSYLLNRDFEPILGDHDTFVTAWNQAEQRNSLTDALLQEALGNFRKPYRISRKAEKFLGDLDTEIEAGWTGAGQTNRLLGRITMRSYIFGNLLYGTALTGKALVDKIVEVAKGLSGFNEFCGHIEDIFDRAKAWARSIEASRYFPFGSKKMEEERENGEPEWNERQAGAARTRITHAITRLEEQGHWGGTVTKRVTLLAEETGSSLQTLYRHKDLWHPGYQVASNTPVENPPDPPTAKETSEGGSSEEAPPSKSHTSLLSSDGRNTSSDKGFSDPKEGIKTLLGVIKERLHHTTRKQQAEREQKQLELALEKQNSLWEKMLDYITSGDPILEAEAQRWFAQQEGGRKE